MERNLDFALKVSPLDSERHRDCLTYSPYGRNVEAGSKGVGLRYARHRI